MGRPHSRAWGCAVGADDELLVRWRKVEAPIWPLPPPWLGLTGWRDPFVLDPGIFLGWSSAGLQFPWLACQPVAFSGARSAAAPQRPAVAGEGQEQAPPAAGEQGPVGEQQAASEVGPMGSPPAQPVQPVAPPVAAAAQPPRPPQANPSRDGREDQRERPEHAQRTEREQAPAHLLARR
jgi:hypothetical protein